MGLEVNAPPAPKIFLKKGLLDLGKEPQEVDYRLHRTAHRLYRGVLEAAMEVHSPSEDIRAG